MIETVRLVGAEAAPRIKEIAALRISVFREYPYLYDGSFEYEEKYLRCYVESPRAVVIVAADEGKVAGAVTGIPLSDDSHEFQEPFRGAEMPVEEIYYLGEILLYPRYRSKRLGSRLLQELEEHAARLGSFRKLACATVIREDDHPRRPDGYLPIDRFCLSHGFARHPELTMTLGWREIDGAEHPNRMMYWLKDLPLVADGPLP